MPCFDYTNCLSLQPDGCVLYTGEDIPSLGLCSGKTTLLEVETLLLQKIQDFSAGTGITLSPVLGCEFVKTAMGTATDLPGILDGFARALCLFSGRVAALETVESATSLDTSCLQGLPAHPTQADVLQALLKKACALEGRLLAVETDYVKASELGQKVAQVLGGQASSQQSVKMVPWVAYEYYGSLSNFDSSGRGITGAGFDKVYLCNGRNGTPDRRGRVAVGTVSDVPGGALDPEVDPSLPGTGINCSLGQTFGVGSVSLTVSQMPPHSHPVIDPGHGHGMGFAGDAKEGSEGNHLRDTPTAYPKKTDNQQTGISLGSAGGGQPHTNYQPSIAAHFIMFIP